MFTSSYFPFFLRFFPIFLHFCPPWDMDMNDIWSWAATHSSILAWRIPGTAEPDWAAVQGVAQSRARLTRLCSSSSSSHLETMRGNYKHVLPDIVELWNHCCQLPASLPSTSDEGKTILFLWKPLTKKKWSSQLYLYFVRINFLIDI